VIYATDPSPARGPDPQAAREAGGSPGVTTPGADCDFMDVPSVECLHEAIFAGSRPPSRQLQHPATTAKPASQNPSTRNSHNTHKHIFFVVGRTSLKIWAGVQ
jgi:hypothetical protein